MNHYKYGMARSAASSVFLRKDRLFFSSFSWLKSFISYFFLKITISQDTNGILIHLQRRFL